MADTTRHLLLHTVAYKGLLFGLNISSILSWYFPQDLRTGDIRSSVKNECFRGRCFCVMDLNNASSKARGGWVRKMSWHFNLKGQRHEDFAVLDQFWAKIINLRLYSLTKCFCKVTTKISNEFYHRGQTIIKFMRIFWRSSIKIWKKLAIFFKLQSISILAIRGDRRQETVSVPSNSLK